MKMTLWSIAEYTAKNIGLALGLVEYALLIFGQILKLSAGIAHLTPSRSDDEWVNRVEDVFENRVITFFDRIKKVLYGGSSPR